MKNKVEYVKHKETARVAEVRRDGQYVWLRLESPVIAPEALPGQFVNARVTNGYDPLLRRPFSIGDADNGELLLMVLVKGKGTAELTKLRPGDSLNLIGPLGNPFPAPAKRPLFVAGGVGTAPFLYFARRLEQHPLALFGFRGAAVMPDMSRFERVADIRLATEDGTAGTKGNVLTLLEGLDLSGFTVYACGPDAMFRALADYFRRNCPAVEAYFSLETYMGCGFGACKGCAVEMSDGSMRLCCTEGPVFPWNEVNW